MDSIGTSLAKDLNVKLNTRIKSIIPEELSNDNNDDNNKKRRWKLITETGEQHAWYDIVVISVPPPQLGPLFSLNNDNSTPDNTNNNNNSSNNDSNYHSTLKSFLTRISPVKMKPCWSVMITIQYNNKSSHSSNSSNSSNQTLLPFDGAFVHNSPLSWIAKDSRYRSFLLNAPQP